MTIVKGTEQIRSFEDWQRLGKPRRATHWVDGRSSKRRARVGVRASCVPEEGNT